MWYAFHTSINLDKIWIFYKCMYIFCVFCCFYYSPKTGFKSNRPHLEVSAAGVHKPHQSGIDYYSKAGVHLQVQRSICMSSDYAENIDCGNSLGERLCFWDVIPILLRDAPTWCGSPMYSRCPVRTTFPPIFWGNNGVRSVFLIFGSNGRTKFAISGPARSRISKDAEAGVCPHLWQAGIGLVT